MWETGSWFERCAISDALSHRGGDSHEFPATPERVLKGLGVLLAGEGR